MSDGWKHPIWLAGTRRTLFVIVLLAIGPITVSAFDLAFNHPSRASIGAPSTPWLIFGTFMWGADSIGIVLAFWLAGRATTAWLAFGAAHLTGVSLRTVAGQPTSLSEQHAGQPPHDADGD